MTDPFVGYIRQIIMTIEDDLDLIRNELRLAEKSWKHTCTNKSNTYFDITYPYFSQLR
jgi:hypothetical protein